MPAENNRIKNEIRVWVSKEDKLKSIFEKSPRIERSIQIEKLKFLKLLLFKYKKTKALDELITLRLVKDEYENVSRKIYPNVVQRLFIEAINAAVFESRDKHEFLRDQELNKINLENQLKNSGFHDVYEKVLDLMHEEQSNFFVPVSYHISEDETLEHNLSFGKDDQGAYQFNGFTSILKGSPSPSGYSCHHFKNEKSESYNVDEAYNMLSGRAVLKNGTWKQFNFYDKDKMDNYRLHEYPEAYGYNVSSVLNTLPLKNEDYESFEKLADSLKKGGREEAVLLIQGNEMKVYLEANPRFKTLTYYNDRMQKTSLNEIKNGCKVTPLMTQHAVDSNTKRKSQHL